MAAKITTFQKEPYYTKTERPLVGWTILKVNWIKIRVPFAVSCCTFLKSVFLQTLNEIVSTSLSIESKTDILYVNMNFTGNLFLGFGRYCDKLYPESAVFHLFWAPALARNVFSVFYSRWLLVNNSRNKRVSAFLLCFIGFEIINFYILFIKMSCCGSNLFF